MPYQTKLPKALDRFGLKVKLVPGWKTRGSSAFNPHGAVGHHTAGPKTGDRPSLNVVIHGRPGLNGPLCNTFLPRGLTVSEQVVYVVAAGRANHAGLGGYRGLVGNSSVFGTEAEDDGVDGVWTDWQKWAFPRVMAAQLWLAGRDETWYCSHRTWAPTRKIDPTGISDAWMKAEIKKAFAHPTPTIIAKPKPPEDEVGFKPSDFWNEDIIPVTTTNDAKTNKTWRGYNALGRVFDNTTSSLELLKAQDTTLKAILAAVKGLQAGSAADVTKAFDDGAAKLEKQLADIKVTVALADDTATP